jgi:hypothetical protein
MTSVKILKLKALLERVYFSTNEKRAGADYTNRIEPVLTGVQILRLEAFLERVLSTNEKRAGADYANRIEPVLTGVQVLELKALLERVIILHTVDQIVMKVEMAETVGHEGVIEPVQPIGG